MTNEQKQVRDWMQQFGQETPDKPCIPDLATRKLRAKLILEEALETVVTGLGLDIYWRLGKRDCKLGPCSRLEFVETGEASLKDIADGCEDLKVVTEGTLVACGLLHQQDVKESSLFNTWTDPLFNEVMRSNFFSKLWTQEEWKAFPDKDQYHSTLICPNPKGSRCILVKDRDGKVIKSPSYSPPNLQPIIDQL